MTKPGFALTDKGVAALEKERVNLGEKHFHMFVYSYPEKHLLRVEAFETLDDAFAAQAKANSPKRHPSVSAHACFGDCPADPSRMVQQ